MYVELWCEEQFNRLAIGPPDFSHEESLPPHVGLLVAAFTRINEPDSIYGITLANEITSQIIRYEHEGDWSSALEYYDLLVRSTPKEHLGNLTGSVLTGSSASRAEDKMLNCKMHKGLMRSLQKTGCSHVLDVYCEGLTHLKGSLQQDAEFIDIQYEAAWRAGNWDFSFFIPYSSRSSTRTQSYCLFNENLHSCLRSLENGDSEEFHAKLCQAKMDLVLALSSTSMESTKYIHSTILKLQMLDHVTMVWDLRWSLCHNQTSESLPGTKKFSPVSTIPTGMQLELLDKEWNFIVFQTEHNLDLFEPFLAFRRALLKVLGCEEHLVTHLFQSASALRKGLRFSLAAAALYELKEHCFHQDGGIMPNTYFLSRLEEAKLLRAQGQHDMAISLGKYILQKHSDKKDVSDVYRLVGKWLAETRSSNSGTIIEDYLRPSMDLTEFKKSTDKRYMSRQCRTHFHMAHYTYSLFKSYEERLSSNEWQAALRLRKYKTRELETLIKRLKSSSKGVKTDYSVKIQELRKQLALDREEAQKIQDDRDNFLNLALQGYQRSLVVGGKYDLQVVFRLVSLWFSLFSRDQVVKAMMKTTKEVQSYKFIPLVYQIASRLGSSNTQGSSNFQQIALASLLKKMALDHPYHTIFQLLALANGDRVKDKQRSRSSFVVDMEKKLAAENLLKELSSCHGALICQMKQMVEIYIKLAELETKKEVPVVTATVPVDPSCQYEVGSFPHFSGLADSIMIMNGINAPKVIECFGSDGNKYRQLAKSGNDDLRQDAVMEQFFSLVNTFLQNHRDTSQRRLRIRTYKVVPFTPSAGVVEWVNGTVPLGEYLLGSTRISGAHGRYGTGDWTYLQCREPVMHHFFLEKFLLPADWFQSRLAYTRSVAASSMVGYIVGLGDRHSMNILIDQDTAEVVHIDLGVAFEQGLMLKTPERVPFRLTRDIIDGMGVTGVEGVFRRCCEKTLSVMRANKEALLTIIEVFVHDPLYKWALSPLKALQRQKEIEDTDSCLDDSQEAYEGNKDAARAILRVKQKLDGYEDGEMRSVQGQVQQLIQDAVDVDRLCQMFPGWGPWL
uniref:Serine/threonine-protein kinase ATM n=1 Tax=Setaria italica TaxID=4555 RepID=K3XE23_SETIT